MNAADQAPPLAIYARKLASAADACCMCKKALKGADSDAVGVPVLGRFERAEIGSL